MAELLAAHEIWEERDTKERGTPSMPSPGWGPCVQAVTRGSLPAEMLCKGPLIEKKKG